MRGHFSPFLGGLGGTLVLLLLDVGGGFGVEILEIIVLLSLHLGI